MRRRDQAGFTLIEIMVASTVGMLVMVPAVAILFRAFAWYEEVQSQIALNRHARETLDVIGNGARMSSNGTDGTKNIYGIRGRRSAPSGTLRTNYRLQYQSNNLTVTPDRFAAMTVKCAGTALPLPDCTGTLNKTVEGWLGNDVTINATSRSVDDRTTEVMVTITDPFAAQRRNGAKNATERYRTVFTLNRDENDP